MKNSSASQESMRWPARLAQEALLPDCITIGHAPRPRAISKAARRLRPASGKFLPRSNRPRSGPESRCTDRVRAACAAGEAVRSAQVGGLIAPRLSRSIPQAQKLAGGANCKIIEGWSA